MAWVRCPMPPNTLRVHTEYVLVKSVGPKDLWAESRVLNVQHQTFLTALDLTVPPEASTCIDFDGKGPPRAANWSHCSLYPATNREQLLSSAKAKLLKNHHPDKAQKPRLPDPIVQPIVVMPHSRMYNTTFVMPLIKRLVLKWD
ncbi:hypothetical protein TNCV_955331 [Trichonephila clavipes]|nr:hypothetical protein TNCV_955331 [Trichonephila clavipes]